MNEARRPQDHAQQQGPRALTSRERDVMVALIRGASPDEGVAVSPEDRRRWLAQVPTTRAGARCRCGTCPSIDLTDEEGTMPADGARVVLGASAEGALVLLFIDDDRLSYLELAPTDDETFAEFPDAASLSF